MFATEIDLSTPEGCLVASDEAEERGETNRAIELREIAHLMTHPDRCVLYVCRSKKTIDGAQPLSGWAIVTWTGAVVSRGIVEVGMSYRSYGFARSTRRRISCIIFGVRYAGTFCESAGDYIRLRKCKTP